MGLGAGVYKDYASLSFAFGGYWKEWKGIPGFRTATRKLSGLSDKFLEPSGRWSRALFGGYDSSKTAAAKATSLFEKKFGKFTTKDWLGLKNKSQEAWAKIFTKGDITIFPKATQKELEKMYQIYSNQFFKSGKAFKYDFLKRKEWLKTTAMKSKAVQKMGAEFIKTGEQKKIARVASQFTKESMKGVKGVKFLSRLGRFAAVAGTAFTAATVISDVSKIASAAASMTIDLPLFIEQKTAPIKKLLINHPEFGGSMTAARYGATERSRALQAITTSGGIINNRRFAGQEARYYSQF